jgi:hypothetical protein
MTTDAVSERIDHEDVDDVIAAAARARDAEVETLSVEELEGIAVELDIPPQLVAPAVQEVRRRRAARLAAERAQAERAARLRRVASLVAAAVVAVLLVVGLWTWVGLRDAWLEAERQRSQVINVLERRAETRGQWADTADSPDKHAELSGAENRVRVERKRYDERVTEYHRQASGPLARVVAAIAGYPPELPLSSEVDEW